MPSHAGALSQWLPEPGVKLVLVLFLSFLIGLEREEHKASTPHYAFGGVRTYPLIGLIGYSLALISKGQVLAVAIGFAVVGGFLMLSYQRKLEAAGMAGVTSEMSGLATYLIGVLVWTGNYWAATSLAVVAIILLELKAGLEGLSQRFPPDELFSFTKFLLLTAVILPILPNRDFTSLHLNPFKTWLVVVAVSAVSYGSYVLQKVTKEKGGILLAALLGGAYSSTVTTVVLAKRSQRELHPHLFSGSTLLASGVMYLRLAILVFLFNRRLMEMLAAPFIALACVAVLVGWLWSRRPDDGAQQVKREYQPGNPLELRAAFTFALIFVAVLIATHLAVEYLGSAGVYGLAALMGVTDVDPFIMGLTQSAGTMTPLTIAAVGIVIAAASNNVVKGIYAFSLSERRTGIQSLAGMVALAIAGLIPLVWLVR